MTIFKWIAATISALALALLTLNADLSLPHFGSEAAAATACPADAKRAHRDVTLNDVWHRSVNLASGKGKVILLDCCATWCGTCQIEVPWFIEFRSKSGQDGMQVIGVPVDDPVYKLKPY